MSRFLRLIDKAAEPVVEYPSRRYSRQIVVQFQRVMRGRRTLRHAIGLAKLVFQLTSGLVMTPVALAAQALGWRFVSVDCRQIGSIYYLELLTRENGLGRMTPRSKLLVHRSRYDTANNFAFDLYIGHVTFIEHPIIKLLLMPFFMCPFSRENTFRFDHDRGGLPEDVRSMNVHQTWNEYRRRIAPVSVHLSESDCQRAKALLEPFLDISKPFVALHVRDGGYYTDDRKTARNADIRTYESAILYLIEKGYQVVRVGDPAMVRIDDMMERVGPYLFDYAHSPVHCELLDCYLAAKCEFFIGTTSGLVCLPYIFDVPTCKINHYNLAACLGFGPKDITTAKLIRRQKDHSLVPFEELFNAPWSDNIGLHALDLHGAYVEDNSSQEVLDTVKEMVEFGCNVPTLVQRQADSAFKPWNHSFGAAGWISETTLKRYDRA